MASEEGVTSEELASGLSKLGPKHRGLAELILLALHREKNHTINDSQGRVSQRLRSILRIPNDKTVRGYISTILRVLETSGLIERERKGEKQTVSVCLPQKLAPSCVRQLLNNEEANLAMFLDERPPTLEEDCQAALTAIRAIAKEEQTSETSNGLFAIAVSGALAAIGLRGQRAKEVRHYLRELGLAAAIRQHATKPVWWWKVSDADLNPEALQQIVLKNPWQPRRGGRGETTVRRMEDTSRERRYAGDTPAVLPDEHCGPVTVRKSEPPESPTPTSPQSPVEQLLGVIKHLEGLLIAREEEIANLQQQHLNEVTELQEEIKRLKSLTDADLSEVGEVLRRYPGVNN